MTSWLRESPALYVCASFESDLLVGAKILFLRAMTLFQMPGRGDRERRPWLETALRGCAEAAALVPPPMRHEALASAGRSLPNKRSFRGGSIDVTEAAQQPLPTVTGYATRCAAVALRKHNIPIEPLLERAGISRHAFDGRQRRISAAAQSAFLECAAEAQGDGAFGLHLAEAANPREAGLLFYVASAAKNLSEALGLVERYSRIVNEAVRLRQRRAPDGVVVEFNFVGLSRHRARQNVEFGVTVIVKALREVVGRSISPTRVTFAHARNSHLREFERFYRCPVEFAASSDQLSFSKETLTLSLITQDPYLLEALQPLCEEAAKERRTAPGSLRSSVENEVQKLLPHGKAKRQAVAKALGMSTRTLSRRLADEDTTFDEVVDRLRQSLALRYIKERELSLSQIAWLVGYEGSTSLNHAFRRWTGRSPSAMRSETRLPAPA